MYEEPPPLVESINKMKGHFENLCEYSSIVRPLLLYEMWSKISDSYNMTINQNPSLEKYIFEKSLKKYGIVNNLNYIIDTLLFDCGLHYIKSRCQLFVNEN